MHGPYRGRTALIATAVVLAAGLSMAGTVKNASAAPVEANTVPATSLQAAWQSVLAEPHIQHALIGGYAYDVTTGRTLASVHPNWRLTPGSVNKLYATAASLADWGGRFGPDTQIAQARPGGPVYLVGGGMLFGGLFDHPGGNTKLAQIAKAVAASLAHSPGWKATVRPRATRVVGVSSLYSGWTSGPGWDISEVGAMGDPSVSALISDGDGVVVRITPATRAGRKPAVTIDPGDPAMAPPGFFRIENDAVTGPAGSSNSLSAWCDPGSDTIAISGIKPLGSRPEREYLAVGNAPLLTAALFQHDLAEYGVKLAKPATTGALPAAARDLYTYRAPQSLANYLKVQNSWSVNEMAENLYRLLGVARHGPGSPQVAQAAISAYLASAHLAQDRVQVDGSGLSVLDEDSASQVVGLLSYVAHQRYFGTFEHSLIHIGPTGQCTFMCGLMDHTAAAWHVWLKTGNLANQWNYAGYAHARNGDLIAFALLFDGLQGNNAFNQAIGPIDAMTVDVASWPGDPRVRRVPPVPPSGGLPASVAALLPAGAAAAARSGYAPGDVLSASVVNVATGKVIAQANGQTELQGGLLGRLATVATALRHTPKFMPHGGQLQATGPLHGRRVDGNLVLNGRYDPMLTRQQLAGMATALARRGIRSVTGRLEYVTGDAQPFGHQPYGVSNLPFSTPQEDVGAWFSPPAGPLVADQDQVSIVVQGAAAPGRQAQVSVEPAGSPVRVTGSVGTVAASTVAASTVAAGAGQASPAAVWQPGSQAYLLSGVVTPGERVTVPVAPPYPALVAADWMLAALRAAGIAVHGGPVAVTTDPGGEQLVSGPAPSAAAEAKQAMSDPSNVAPFDLYQQLGPRAGADVAALVGRYDQIIDPSGDAADNFLTAGSISEMLAAGYRDRSQAPLTALLSRPWIVHLPERTTVAGYAREPGGRLVAYTVIINGQMYDPVPDLPSRFEPVISP